MKLLKLKISTLTLFKEGIEIDFTAQQRVSEQSNQGLTHVFGSIYLNNAVGIIGINASGKTTVLKFLSFALSSYMHQGRLNDEEFEFLHNENHFSMEAIFFTENEKILKVESTICRNEDEDLYFSEEKIWIKSPKTLKKTLYVFKDKELVLQRSMETSPYLADDMSIMMAYSKKDSLKVMDLIRETNRNVMKTAGKVPLEMVGFLDRSIDYLFEEIDENNKLTIRLKFRNQKKEIFLNDHRQLESYLSSGTIKGVTVLLAVEQVFKTGGIMLIDEIENHFNKEIVRTIVGFFRNEKINKKGSTLVFTTHYSELLDDFDRNDSIYFTLKEDTLRIKNLKDLLNRNDFKKSEVYQSSYLGKTAPSYDAYMQLKKYFQKGNN